MSGDDASSSGAGSGSGGGAAIPCGIFLKKALEI